MPKLDGLKEKLNTIRLTVTIMFALLVALVAGAIKRIDSDKIDIYLYMAGLIIIVIMLFLPFLVKKITKITKEIEEL